MFKDDLGLPNDDKIFMKKRKENPIFTNKLFIVLSFVVNDIKTCPNGVLYVQYQIIIKVF